MTARPTVVVVGLGPGAAGHVTVETREAIAATGVCFVRTAKHPAVAALLLEAVDLAGREAPDVVDALVAAAVEHGRVLYAVPGSPLVLERTVPALVADGRVDVDIRPALSFLDLAWARLGVDPVADSVRLGDAADADALARVRAPALVVHVHDEATLHAARDALAGVGGDAPVVALARLGHDDEAVTATTFAALAERVGELDAWTCVYVPAGERVDRTAGYQRFHELARTLRETCPWDREQTHASLAPYLVEEAFELVDAIAAHDPADPATVAAVVEELGDVLYQIEFHATIAEQAGAFTIDDVTAGIHDKLVRRHPHVFGDVDAAEIGDVLANWDVIKRAEKGRQSVFDGIATSLPALAYAQQVLAKAARIGIERAGGAADDDDLATRVLDLVDEARRRDVDLELATRAAVNTFRSRAAARESSG